MNPDSPKLNNIPVKILIVDDHKLFSEGLASLLRSEENLRVVGTVARIEDIASEVHRLNPDLILMDMNIRGEISINISSQILKNYDAKIIMVTMYNQEKLLKEAQKAGVHGYLLKDSSAAEILKCIKDVIKGETYFDHKIIYNDIGDYFSKTLQLTFKEKEIIKYISDGFTNEEIASTLFLSPLTVKTHRKNIYYKLGVTNTAQLMNFMTGD